MPKTTMALSNEEMKRVLYMSVDENDESYSLSDLRDKEWDGLSYAQPDLRGEEWRQCRFCGTPANMIRLKRKDGGWFVQCVCGGSSPHRIRAHLAVSNWNHIYGMPEEPKKRGGKKKS